MRVHLRRRSRSLIVLAAAAVVAFSAFAASGSYAAATKAAPFKIGFITPASGSQSTNFELARQGVLAALSIVNKRNIAGRPFAMTFADDAADPRTAADACNRLVNQEHVQAIIGFESTPARAACNPFLLPKNVPYIAGQPSPGDFCPPNMFLTGFIANQQINPFVDYLYKQGARRFYFVGNNFSSAKAAEATLKAKLGTKSGASEVGSSYEPFGTTDWSAEISKMNSAKADVVMVILVGNDEISFWKQVASDPRVKDVKRADPLLSVANAIATGPAANGIYTINTYFQSLPGKGNKDFKAALKAKFGKKAEPDNEGALLYDAVFLLARAVRSAHSTDGAKIIDALNHTSFSGPRGPVGWTPTSKGFMTLNVYIGVANATGNFKVVGAAHRIKPVPTC